MAKETQTQKSQKPESLWFRSYQSRHIISDNFADRRAWVGHVPPYENQDYCVSYIVLQGTMNLKINLRVNERV